MDAISEIMGLVDNAGSELTMAAWIDFLLEIKGEIEIRLDAIDEESEEK